jgi:hypothetical protein
VVGIELLQRLAAWEAGSADTALTTVGLPGGHLALQTRGQELLIQPGLGPGPLGQPLNPSASDGAFSARVRWASSLAMLRPLVVLLVVLAAITRLLVAGQTEQPVEIGQAAVLHRGVDQPNRDRTAGLAQWGGGSPVGGIGDALMTTPAPRMPRHLGARRR